MKKTTKKSPTMKIMSAAAMLAVSASMLGTSTYAWFTMNKSVSVQQMSISAKSDNPHLLVADTANGTYAESLTWSPTLAATLNLVTPLNVASNVPYYATSNASSTTTPSKFTGADDVLWGTAYSTKSDEVQANNITTLVGAADLDDYVLQDDLYFKVVANTADATNLTLSKVTFNDGTNDIAASGRVLVVSETGKYQLFNLVDGEVTTHTGDDALVATVSTSPVKLTVYFYFDGTAATSYTDIAEDLTAVTASYIFSVDDNGDANVHEQPTTTAAQQP